MVHKLEKFNQEPPVIACVFGVFGKPKKYGDVGA